jgi:alkylhydroperoxidase/carboxymuconolactone decarboxylase family protein YurZ
MERLLGSPRRSYSGLRRSILAAGVAIYTSGVFSTKEIELISIALNASYTHMYAFGTRRHIKAALKAGAAVEEIMEILKICVVQGVQSCNLGVPILAEELSQLSSASESAGS